MKELVKIIILAAAMLLLGFELGRYYESQQNPINKIENLLKQ